MGIFESTLNEKSSPDRKVYFLNNNDRAKIYRPLTVDLKKRDLQGLHLIGQKKAGLIEKLPLREELQHNGAMTKLG